MDLKRKKGILKPNHYDFTSRRLFGLIYMPVRPLTEISTGGQNGQSHKQYVFCTLISEPIGKKKKKKADEKPKYQLYAHKADRE